MSPKTPEKREKIARIPYVSEIGSLMYAMLCTRSYIAYAVSLSSRFQSNQGLENWTTVKSILKYFKRTKDLILICEGGDLQLDGFIEYDF